MPTVAGWQSHTVFDETVFVSVHESSPGVLYGLMFLPDKPIMQSDGQTQTGALFALNAMGLAHAERDHLFTTLEIELNVDPKAAAQSFVDRNGRGTKKNKNLVAAYNTIAGLPTLRNAAVAGNHLRGPAPQRSQQRDRRDRDREHHRPEHPRADVPERDERRQPQARARQGYHVSTFSPILNDFFCMLDRCFGADWPAKTPEGGDPYRRVYVHGWPFAFKAIALAYFEARENEIAPLWRAIKIQDAHDTTVENEKTYKARLAETLNAWEPKTTAVDVEGLEKRLKAMDWHRWRQHWVDIAGFPVDEDGNPRIKTLADGTTVIATSAPNTATVISKVKNKILSPAWKDLTKKMDAPCPDAIR